MSADAQTFLDLLTTLAEPTRLRIVNCLRAAPLFVSDLQALLDVPQPTVSRHLRVLRDQGVVRDTPIGQFVLYRLRRVGAAEQRIVSAVLDAAQQDPALRSERASALQRSRRHAQTRAELDFQGRPV
jgi:ArsR family transcriptional regulator